MNECSILFCKMCDLKLLSCHKVATLHKYYLRNVATMYVAN